MLKAEKLKEEIGWLKMDRLVIFAFAVFLTGLGIVAGEAISHARKSSPQKPEKPKK